MAEKQNKENFFKRAASAIAKFAKATKSEVKKISWPTGKQLTNNTIIVIACIIVVGILIFVLDSIFGLGFNFLNNQKLESEEPVELSTDVLADLEYSLEDLGVELGTESAE